MIYPGDIDAACGAWGANCGPCSLAAVLRRQVEAVRPLLGDFEERGYMNVTHQKAALDAAGAWHTPYHRQRPERGLVMVQWGGFEKLPVRAQYHFTHWIGVDRDMVFDVNADELVTWDAWERTIPSAMKMAGDGDGTYFIRSAISVPFFLSSSLRRSNDTKR